MGADSSVQIIGEEGIELNPEKPTFRQEGAVLLDGGEEVRRCISAGEDDGFAAEGPDLGSADVENIAEAGDIRQGHICRRAGQAISEAGSVDEERQAVFFADSPDSFQFGAGVDSAVFAWK